MAKRFSISAILKVIDQATGPMKKVNSVVSKSIISFKKLQERMQALAPAAKKVGKAMVSIGQRLSIALTAPLTAFGILSIKTAADIEQLQISFESMLGSTEAASDMVKKLIDFTARTPFQLDGVAGSAKQLLAFGVAQENVLDRLRVLGDISSGAGIPLNEMAQIFGKIKAKGKAMTEELLQLSDRGVPIIDVLAKKFNVSKNVIFDAASKSKISFDIMLKALTEMTEEGGIFADQMGKQSRSIAGLFSTLKDNVTLSLAKIGNVLTEVFNLRENIPKMIVLIQKWTEAFSKFSKQHPLLTKIGIAIASILALVGPLLIALGLIAQGVAIISAVSLPITGTILAIVAGIAALITVTVIIWRKWDDLVKVWQKVPTILKPIVTILGFLIAPLVFIVTAVIAVIKNWDRLVATFKKAKSELEIMANFIKEIADKLPLIKLAKFGFEKLFPGTEANKEVKKNIMNQTQETKTETKIKLEVTGKDGASAEVKNIKGNAPVEVANEVMVGAF